MQDLLNACTWNYILRFDNAVFVSRPVRSPKSTRRRANNFVYCYITACRLLLCCKIYENYVCIMSLKTVKEQ